MLPFQYDATSSRGVLSREFHRSTRYPVARCRDSLRTSVIRDDSQPRSVHLSPPGTAPLLEAALPPRAGEVCASIDRADVTDPEEFALTSLPLASLPVDKRQPEGNSTELTPFMRQWTAAKKQNPDALLFFRMGDFYELFYDDAATASRELQLTLTARDSERSIPMCGVPYHAVEQYLTRLLRKGYRIALCDQMEDPKLTKKMVRREVTRVLSPGTALDAALGQEQNNFLAALYEATPKGARAAESVCALALLDVSTGEFRTAEFRGADARAQAIDALLLAAPSEVLVAASAELPPQLERIPARTRIEDWVWTRDFAVPLVERQLNVHSLEGFGLDGHEPAAIAAGAVLHYVRTTQKNEALHIDCLEIRRALHGARTRPSDGPQPRTGGAALCGPG